MTRHLLFVCTGNICRSPMAEGLMRHLIEQTGLAQHISIDSAGTHASEGAPPDATAVEIAAEHGVDISMLRARPFLLYDFERFDLILMMDNDHRSQLGFLCPPGLEHKLRMLMSFAQNGRNTEVADPYKRRRRFFERAWTDIERGCNGLLAAERTLAGR